MLRVLLVACLFSDATLTEPITIKLEKPFECPSLVSTFISHWLLKVTCLVHWSLLRSPWCYMVSLTAICNSATHTVVECGHLVSRWRCIKRWQASLQALARLYELNDLWFSDRCFFFICIWWSIIVLILPIILRWFLCARLQVLLWVRHCRESLVCCLISRRARPNSLRLRNELLICALFAALALCWSLRDCDPRFSMGLLR